MHTSPAAALRPLRGPRQVGVHTSPAAALRPLRGPRQVGVHTSPAAVLRPLRGPRQILRGPFFLKNVGGMLGLAPSTQQKWSWVGQEGPPEAHESAQARCKASHLQNRCKNQGTVLLIRLLLLVILLLPYGPEACLYKSAPHLEDFFGIVQVSFKLRFQALVQKIHAQC